MSRRRTCEWTVPMDDGGDVLCRRPAVSTLLVIAHRDVLELALCAGHLEEARALPTVVEEANGELIMRWA